MCAVSMVSDGWKDQFPYRWPNYPTPEQLSPNVTPSVYFSPVNRLEFDMLKNEVEELKKLLLAAKKFDEATGQPNCEQDEKVKFIRRVAESVGVDLEEVFGKK